MSGLGRRDDRGYDQGFLPGGTTPFGANRRYCWLTAEAKRNGGSRILELGWGPGAVAEVLAIDISDKFLNRARVTFSLQNLRFAGGHRIARCVAHQ